MPHLMDVSLIYRFIAALLIGILIGFEREHSHEGSHETLFAGDRTFALLGLFGAMAAMITDELATPWVFVGMVLILGTMITGAYVTSAMRGKMGMTTEVSALVTVLVGGLCYWGYLQLAVAIGVLTTIILSLKVELGRFVQRTSKEDIYATLKFAVLVVIVLPVLPQEPLAGEPFDVLVPYKLGLMVVFISGISFLGYVLSKAVGAQRGIGLTGLVGGLVSSTAVTLGFSQRSQSEPELSRPFALAIISAWTMMFGRVLLAVAALNRNLLTEVWLPVTAAAVAGVIASLFLYFTQRTHDSSEVEFSNPFTLGPALQFGLLYAVILLVSSVAQTYFGDTGVYLSSLLAGITDVDAITLSMAELGGAPGGVNLTTAGIAVMLAIASNVIVKGGIVILSGSAALRRALLPGFLAMLIVGVAVTLIVLV